MTSYAYARVGRAGLANRLFPWARCEIFAAEQRMRMIAPQWVQPKIGPILRGEADWRFYNGQFGPSSYVTGVRRLALLLAGVVVPETRVREASVPRGGRPRIVTFGGIGPYFTPLLGHHQMLRARLLDVLSPTSAVQLRGASSPSIAVHVRRGDFVTGSGKGGSPSSALPDGWYVGCLRALRRLAGRPVPATVFSDGTVAELGAILAEPAVTLAPPAAAVVDLLTMARARVLVTTGVSTFSMWAAFLGGMPSLWYPEQVCPTLAGGPSRLVETTREGELAAADVTSLHHALHDEVPAASAPRERSAVAPDVSS